MFKLELYKTMKMLIRRADGLCRVSSWCPLECGQSVGGLRYLVHFESLFCEVSTCYADIVFCWPGLHIHALCILYLTWFLKIITQYNLTGADERGRGGEAGTNDRARQSGKGPGGPERGPAAYFVVCVFVFQGSIITCRLYQLSVPNQGEFTLQLRVNFSDFV